MKLSHITGTKRVFFLDVRPPALYGADPAGFIRVPYSVIEKEYSKIPKGDTVYVIDAFGYFSERVAQFLESKGYNVSVISGGVISWAFLFGPMEYEDETLNKRLSSKKELLPYNQIKALAAEVLELEVDYSKFIPPDMEYKFTTPEEQQKALQDAMKQLDLIK